MTSKLEYAGLFLLFVGLIAAPGAAQPLRRVDEAPSPSKSQTSAPQGEEPEASTEPASREPPPWLRRRPSDEGTRGAVLQGEDSDPVRSLFLWLLSVGLFLFIMELARSWITTNIPLRSVLGALVFGLRIAAFSLLVAIVFEAVPAEKNWILWALAVLALVVGWSVRDLFADVVAGVVLAAERRVKKGMWVSGDGFQGTVEGRSLRATWLRDGQGHRITVPNRAMVGAPMVYDVGADAEHEVVVRLDGYRDAGNVRLALTDAILSSPWVLAGATPVVLRDPADPIVWRVRTKLLEPRFSVHFEGELLERVEDLLHFEPAPSDDETAASPTVPKLEQAAEADD